jgi:hypothetical protein
LSFAESALLASTALTIAVAQETQEGAQEQIIKKPATNSAMVAAPGQQQKSGDTTAREATPGQQQKSGDADASETAPGQQKASGETSAEKPHAKELKKQTDATGDQSEVKSQAQRLVRGAGAISRKRLPASISLLKSAQRSRGSFVKRNPNR